MKVLKKVAGVVETIVLIALLALTIFFIISRIFGMEPMVVLSGSMEPTIKTGSIIFTNPNYDYEDVKIGDVVVFQNQETDMKVVHRVIEKNPDGEGYITKGDNNENADGVTVTEQTLVGSEMLTIPFLGYAVNVLNNQYAKFAICFVVLFLVIDVIITNVNGRRKESKDE